MIKVLVVDDDRLARRGIIAEMPWDAFDMKVVGEANNGENALEFLRSEEVDLLITDLAMPIMSGLDLMREVQRLYPKIWFVVLTFHQDFELIQEALRIGAIDYIAKTQIEDARMEEVLERISERIRRSQEASLPNAERRSAEPTAAADSMLVYIAGAGQADFGALWQHTSMQGQTIQEVSLGLWTVLPEREMTDEDVAAMKRELVELGLERQVTVLHIRGIRDTDREQLRQRLLRYKEISLFYERKPGVFYYEYTAGRLQVEYPGWSDEELRRNRDAWSSLHWIVRTGAYEELLQEIERARPSAAQLANLFYTARMSWVRISREEAGIEEEMPGTGALWSEWTGWLSAVRGKLRAIVAKSAYSEEIAQSIMSAVDYINLHLEEDIRHSDLAKQANMSKGYFSQCFKEIVGRTFHDYIRDARIENAQLLLAETKQPIYRIAEQCGYANEKYFSRVFREQTGRLPSEYRQEKAKV